MKLKKFIMRLSQVIAFINLCLFGYMTCDAWGYYSQDALDVGLEMGELLEFCLVNTVLSGIAYLVYAIILYCVYCYLKDSISKTDVEKIENPKVESAVNTEETTKEDEPETLNIEKEEN